MPKNQQSGGIDLERLTLRNLLRLFYRHMVDFIPVVGDEGKVKGVLLKSKIVSLTGRDLKDLDQTLTKDLLSFLMDGFSEVKGCIAELLNNKDIKIPVVTLEGELYGFWNAVEFMEALGGKRSLSLSLVTELLEKLPFALGIFSNMEDLLYSNSPFRDIFKNEQVKNWHFEKIRENKGLLSAKELELFSEGKKWEGLLIPLRSGECINGWAFLWEDVTELEGLLTKASQLAAIQRCFEEIFNFIDDGVWYVDFQERILFCNAAFKQLFDINSPVNKFAWEVFGSSWFTYPIYKSLKDGKDASGQDIIEKPQGKKFYLERKAFPVKIFDKVIGAIEIVSSRPFFGVLDMGEWIELGELSKEAFLKGAKAFEEGSIFIWGPKGVGKTHLAVKILEGKESVIFISSGFPLKGIDKSNIMFVENLDSFDEKDLSMLVDLIKSCKSVVTSRLPLSCFPGLLSECFKAIIYLPPLSQRWEEVEKFLKIRFPELNVEMGTLSRLKGVSLKENFRSLLELAKNGFVFNWFGDNLLGKGLTLKEALEEKEREIIMEAFSSCEGNITKTAKLLGIPRQTLQYKLKRLGIKR